MKTTNAKAPTDLLRALKNKPTANRVFQNMRPSCQARYTAPVQKAEDKQTRRTKVANAVRGIMKYGNKHPRLKSKLYKKREVSAR
jgi:uncharacterized protein YdeI (YjbR/CyaY-like superfamily)